MRMKAPLITNIIKSIAIKNDGFRKTAYSQLSCPLYGS